jgi:hypothetical protein
MLYIAALVCFFRQIFDLVTDIFDSFLLFILSSDWPAIQSPRFFCAPHVLVIGLLANHLHFYN